MPPSIVVLRILFHSCHAQHAVSCNAAKVEMAHLSLLENFDQRVAEGRSPIAVERQETAQKYAVARVHRRRPLHAESALASKSWEEIVIRARGLFPHCSPNCKSALEAEDAALLQPGFELSLFRWRENRELWNPVPLAPSKHSSCEPSAGGSACGRDARPPSSSKDRVRPIWLMLRRLGLNSHSRDRWRQLEPGSGVKLSMNFITSVLSTTPRLRSSLR